MALTQTATIPGPGPSWDEEVVPALRKRLQSESRTIARRISAISVTSADDAVNTTFSSDYTYRDNISATNSYQGAPTPARPRPSLQQTRTGSDNGPSRVNPTKSPSTRSRTYSQPWPSDAKQNGRHNGSAVARAVSPRQEPRPTRIPKPARSRAGSTSSHSYSLNGSAASPYSSPKSPQPDPDLFILHEKPGAASRSTISVNSRQDSGLLHEPPPFRAGSATSSNDNSSDNNNRRVMDLDPPRPSIDSEERPYEHWYRGDVSRNGGVGELRVAKRQEMLEIANYGHSLRTNQGPRNALTDALEEGRRRRRRADSVGPTNRQSFYMEDHGFVQVKDESPLTDLENSDPEHTSDYHTPAHSYHEENSSASASAMYSPRSMTPTMQRPSSRQQQQSRIPTPTREPPRTATPNQLSRGSSEPPSLPSTSTPKSTPKRAASPQTSSATKKSRTQAAKATRAKAEAAKKERDELANRRSVAHYPTPGDDMRDAIPSWTQPVPREGNWDDVVLPVVARKKGLDEHYEQADGSPRARQVESVIAPAPGTFGYDHSKYRPPRDDDPSSIPMDEFGQRQENGGIVEEENVQQPRHAPPPPISTNHDRTPLPVRVQPPSSPVPFSHYAPNTTVKLQPVSSAGATKLEVQEASHHQQQSEEDDAGGCCKCVVM